MICQANSATFVKFFTHFVISPKKEMIYTPNYMQLDVIDNGAEATFLLLASNLLLLKDTD